MWFGGEYIYRIHFRVGLPSLLDPLDDCKLRGALVSFSSTSFAWIWQRYEPAMFLLRMSSSLTELSMIFLELLSTIRHFHCVGKVEVSKVCSAVIESFKRGRGKKRKGVVRRPLSDG